MSNEDLYVQCRLLRNNSEQVAWIPKRGAIEGVYVELLDDSTLWKVAEVYGAPLTEAYIREKQKMDRRSLLSIK
jgi:hypothetical protein